MKISPKTIIAWGALAVLAISYIAAAILGGGAGYSTDEFLKARAMDKGSEVALRIDANNVDVSRGVLSFTATPQLSGEFGQSTGNGAFLQQPVMYSFDVFEGPTKLNPGAGNLVGGQNLGIRIAGEPANYPFDSYSGKFYANGGVSGYNSTVQPFYMWDISTPLPGFSASSRYLSFFTEKVVKSEIKTDISQGTGLIEWQIRRSFSTIFAAFLFGGLMLVGAIASLLMSLSVLRGHRPPSINSLTWLAAFLFALFQVRGQLPGDPPSGVRFDMFIFFPVILLLICLIMINVSLWNKREDWDMENPIVAVRGRRSDSGLDS
ncbi:Protein of unknown function (DUF4436) [Candidatus Nanopelagicaceae bacterium]